MHIWGHSYSDRHTLHGAHNDVLMETLGLDAQVVFSEEAVQSFFVCVSGSGGNSLLDPYHHFSFFFSFTEVKPTSLSNLEHDPNPYFVVFYGTKSKPPCSSESGTNHKVLRYMVPHQREY